MKTIGMLNSHFESNFWLYIISFFCIFLGVMLGVYSVKYLGTIENTQLITYLTSFTDAVAQKNINNSEIFFQAIKNNSSIILAIWFLGLTLIGTPLILIFDILKGYTLGFSISLIIKGLGFKGVSLILMGILPQNIFYVPCIMFASVYAMEFSISFLKNNVYKHSSNNIFGKIATYSLLFVIINIIMLVGFVIEAFLTPFIIKTILH